MAARFRKSSIFRQKKPRTKTRFLILLKIIYTVRFFLENPKKPNKAEPNNQAAAGTGTAETAGPNSNCTVPFNNGSLTRRPKNYY